MSQIVPGIVLGRAASGGIVYEFHGEFDPNLATVFSQNIPPATVALGSIFLRTDLGQLFLKTAQPNTWTQK
jgi:hypothetical protein